MTHGNLESPYTRQWENSFSMLERGESVLKTLCVKEKMLEVYNIFENIAEKGDIAGNQCLKIMLENEKILVSSI